MYKASQGVGVEKLGSRKWISLTGNQVRSLLKIRLFFTEVHQSLYLHEGNVKLGAHLQVGLGKVTLG